MSKDREIRELFARHKVELDRDDIWAVQGTPVVKHKALERLGAAMQLAWDKPQVLLAERDAAAVLVSGTAANGYEWSIGEAVIGQNYKVSPKVAAYPYAMAEKRGKDRVILKLAGLQGVYSEEEADDFKSRDPEPSNEPETGNQAEYIERCLRYIDEEAKLQNLKAWWERELPTIKLLKEADRFYIHNEFLAKGKKLAASSTVEAA